MPKNEEGNQAKQKRRLQQKANCFFHADRLLLELEVDELRCGIGGAVCAEIHDHKHERQIYRPADGENTALQLCRYVVPMILRRIYREQHYEREEQQQLRLQAQPGHHRRQGGGIERAEDAAKDGERFRQRLRAEEHP